MVYPGRYPQNDRLSHLLVNILYIMNPGKAVGGSQKDPTGCYLTLRYTNNSDLNIGAVQDEYNTACSFREKPRKCLSSRIQQKVQKSQLDPQTGVKFLEQKKNKDALPNYPPPHEKTSGHMFPLPRLPHKLPPLISRRLHQDSPGEAISKT